MQLGYLWRPYWRCFPTTFSTSRKKSWPSPSHWLWLLSFSSLSWFTNPSYLFVIHVNAPSSTDCTGKFATLISSLTLSSKRPCSTSQRGALTDQGGPSFCPLDNGNNMQGWWLNSENIKIAPVSIPFFSFLKISEILILKHLKYTYIQGINPTWFDTKINERYATCLTITRKPVSAVKALRIYGANDLFK